MFAKIFRQILDSSIVENPEVRFTFMDLLILADSKGVVDMTPESIARRTNRRLDVILSSIKALEADDPRSRTPTHNGKRLLKLDNHRDWGWQIINYENYRKIKKEFDRKEYMRSYMAEKRPSRSKVKPGLADSLTSVNKVSQSPSPSPSVQESLGGQGAFAEIPTWDEVRNLAAMRGVLESSAKRFFDYHQDNNLWINKTGRLINWESKLVNWQVEDRQRGFSSPSPKSLGPKSSDVQSYFQEKWGDDQRCSGWAASFLGYWSDQKRDWKRNGVPIDWKVEASRQVSKWRSGGSDAN